LTVPLKVKCATKLAFKATQPSRFIGKSFEYCGYIAIYFYIFYIYIILYFSWFL
jgi:hypothetical protein